MRTILCIALAGVAAVTAGCEIEDRPDTRERDVVIEEQRVEPDRDVDVDVRTRDVNVPDRVEVPDVDVNTRDEQPRDEQPRDDGR